MTNDDPLPAGPHRPTKRRRLNFRRLVRYQFVVAPVFLMPVTMRQSLGSAGGPSMWLTTQILVPVVYVAVMIRMRSRSASAGRDHGNSPVLAGILSGVGYALLVAAMSWGWVLYLPARRLIDLVATDLLFISFSDLFLPTLIFPIQLSLHYALIGAVTGCLMGLIAGKTRSNQ